MQNKRDLRRFHLRSLFLFFCFTSLCRYRLCHSRSPSHIPLLFQEKYLPLFRPPDRCLPHRCNHLHHGLCRHRQHDVPVCSVRRPAVPSGNNRFHDVRRSKQRLCTLSDHHCLLYSLMSCNCNHRRHLMSCWLPVLQPLSHALQLLLLHALLPALRQSLPSLPESVRLPDSDLPELLPPATQVRCASTADRLSSLQAPPAVRSALPLFLQDKIISRDEYVPFSYIT